jgi:flavin-dependent dehydrogenase
MTRRQMGGIGWVMIGDAFAFLDPVFSSGVYLAMSGAEQAVAVVDTALRDPTRGAAAAHSWSDVSAPA